jgi:hypothetical protein
MRTDNTPEDCSAALPLTRPSRPGSSARPVQCCRHCPAALPRLALQTPGRLGAASVRAASSRLAPRTLTRRLRRRTRRQSSRIDPVVPSRHRGKGSPPPTPARLRLPAPPDDRPSTDNPHKGCSAAPPLTQKRSGLNAVAAQSGHSSRQRQSAATGGWLVEIRIASSRVGVGDSFARVRRPISGR